MTNPSLRPSTIFLVEKFASEIKDYRKTPKISDARRLSCSTPKIQIKGPNVRVFLQKDSNGIANSEDLDQTAPLGAV